VELVYDHSENIFKFYYIIGNDDDQMFLQLTRMSSNDIELRKKEFLNK